MHKRLYFGSVEDLKHYICLFDVSWVQNFDEHIPKYADYWTNLLEVQRNEG